MSNAQAANFESSTFCGPADCAMVGNKSKTAYGNAAREIASYFMANMGSDVFTNNQAHSLNLAAIAGIKNAGLNFAFANNAPEAPSNAPMALGNNGIEIS